MRRVDQDALRRALAMAKAESPGRREQLEAKLADEPWLEVAMFAAYVCQTRSLRLHPWECPPSHTDVGRPGLRERPESDRHEATARSRRAERL
jgi:hypothetical protein